MAHLRDKPARRDNAGRGSRFRRVRKTKDRLSAAFSFHAAIRKSSGFLFDAFSWREPVPTSLENAEFLFDAFSWREPVSTSLENAL
jgi:hypothetical protein